MSNTANRVPKIVLTPREKIIKARIELLRAHPFFGTIAMNLKPIELTEKDVEKYLGDMPTIAVDEYGNMPYNKEFIEKATIEDVMFYLAHESMHVALEHIWRMGSRDNKAWNLASDFAENYLLEEEMRLPEHVLGHNDDTYKGKAAEEIYGDMVNKGKKYIIKMGGKAFDKMIPPTAGGGGQGNQPQQKGPFWKPGQSKLDPNKIVKDAITFAKNQGHLPAGMERVFKEMFETQMSWKELLLKYINEILPKDWTYMKPSKRFSSTGVYIPSVTKQEIELYIALDSSGSISDVEYSTFLSEVATIVTQFENVKGFVLVCDAEVQDVTEIDNQFDPAFMHGHGYGGTSCIPVFKWIKDEKDERIKLLIYMTDGYIDEPTEEVYSGDYPVLWIVTKKGQTNFLHDNIGRQMVIQMESGNGEDVGDD